LMVSFSGIDFPQPQYQDVDTHVEFLTISDEDLESEIRFQITCDVLYQEILQIWQKHKR